LKWRIVINYAHIVSLQQRDYPVPTQLAHPQTRYLLSFRSVFLASRNPVIAQRNAISALRWQATRRVTFSAVPFRFSMTGMLTATIAAWQYL
jgi:hypothetical protein